MGIAERMRNLLEGGYRIGTVRKRKDGDYVKTRNGWVKKTSGRPVGGKSDFKPELSPSQRLPAGWTQHPKYGKVPAHFGKKITNHKEKAHSAASSYLSRMDMVAGKNPDHAADTQEFKDAWTAAKDTAWKHSNAADKAFAKGDVESGQKSLSAMKQELIKSKSLFQKAADKGEFGPLQAKIPKLIAHLDRSIAGLGSH